LEFRPKLYAASLPLATCNRGGRGVGTGGMVRRVGGVWVQRQTGPPPLRPPGGAGARGGRCRRGASTHRGLPEVDLRVPRVPESGGRPPARHDGGVRPRPKVVLRRAVRAVDGHGRERHAERPRPAAAAHTAGGTAAVCGHGGAEGRLPQWRRGEEGRHRGSKRRRGRARSRTARPPVPHRLTHTPRTPRRATCGGAFSPLSEAPALRGWGHPSSRAPLGACRRASPSPAVPAREVQPKTTTMA
jgi:hypothetical protein